MRAVGSERQRKLAAPKNRFVALVIRSGFGKRRPYRPLLMRQPARRRPDFAHIEDRVCKMAKTRAGKSRMLRQTAVRTIEYPESSQKVVYLAMASLVNCVGTCCSDLDRSEAFDFCRVVRCVEHMRVGEFGGMCSRSMWLNLSAPVLS